MPKSVETLPTTDEIVDALDVYTDDELRDLNTAIVDTLKARRSRRTKRAVRDLEVGDRVSFEGKDGQTVTGEITKVNRKTVDVLEDGDDDTPDWKRGSWRVSGTLVDVIDDDGGDDS